MKRREVQWQLVLPMHGIMNEWGDMWHLHATTNEVEETYVVYLLIPSESELSHALLLCSLRR